MNKRLREKIASQNRLQELLECSRVQAWGKSDKTLILESIRERALLGESMYSSKEDAEKAKIRLANFRKWGEFHQ